jgi:hypothetical protein
MPMPPYPVRCYTPGCGREAVYKIAARWSDGVTGELKTYALTCADCVGPWFSRARQSRAACRLAPGESLKEPEIYQIVRGARDQQLERLPDVEARFAD